MGWVYVGSAGVLGLQLLLVACGKSDKVPASAAGGAADTGDAGQSSSGKANTAGSTSHGGSSSGVKSSCGSVKPTDLDGFLEAEGDCFCPRLFQCVEGDDDFSTQRMVLKNEQGCKDLLARINANSHAFLDLRAQIAAGNIHYDAEQGQKCLVELGSCNGVDSISAGPCREAFEGNAKTGEPCVRSEDCAGDAYCDTSEACGGQCTPRKQDGEPCDLATDCAYTTGTVFCDRSSTGSVCHTLAPTAKAAEGEPCTRKFEGAEALTLCQDGLWCATAPGGDTDADVLGQCAPPIPPDGPCQDGDDFCTEGWCDTDASACRSVTLVATAGAACDQNAATICDPTLGFHCNAAGTCDASGDGSEGSACFGSDLQRGCDAGLYCAKAADTTSNDPGTCRAFLAEGDTCINNRDCSSGNCTEEGVCGERPCLQ